MKQKVANYIYNYRYKNKIKGNSKDDWFKAERFLNRWQKEYEEAGSEFLRVWLDMIYKKQGG